MAQKVFKFISIVLVSISVFFVYSCSTPKNMLNKNIVIGKNHLTKSDILADGYVFPESIYDFYIDTTKRNITVQTRIFRGGQHPNKIGKLYQYDFSLQNLKWNRSIDYKYYEFFQQDSLILRVHDDKVCCINSEDGKKDWSATYDLFHIINANLIGFKDSKWYRNKQLINGIDLNNGKSIWNRDISLINRSQGALRINDTVAMLVADGLHTYNLKNGTGWDRFIFMPYGCYEILKLNDSTNLVVADGLYSVNLNNGTGWGFNGITTSKHYIKRDNYLTTLGVAMGLFQGNFIYSPLTSGLTQGNLEHPKDYSVICDIASNVIIDNSEIYWASKQNIVKLDTSGKVQWECNLPEDEISKSKIFLNDRVICQLNLGYAFSITQHHNIIYGQPFIAGFDKKTGNKLYYQSLMDNKNPVIGYKEKNKALILFSNSKLSKYSMSNGEFIKEKTINTDSLGLLDCFVTKDTYVLKDSVLICLNDSNSSNYCILTRNKKIIQINDQLEVLNKLDNKDSYVNYLEKYDLKFVGNSTDSYILDTNNNVIANLKASNKSVLFGSKLYDKQEKTMIIIDLKDLIKI